MSWVKVRGLDRFISFQQIFANFSWTYKAALQNQTLNFESPKLIFSNFKLLGFGLKFERGVAIGPSNLRAWSSLFFGSGEGDTLLVWPVVGGWGGV